MSLEAPGDLSAAVDAKFSRPHAVADPFQICGPLSQHSIVGAPVRGANGAKVGIIHTVMTDLTSGRIAYVVLRLAGRWPFRRRLRPVLWQSLRFVRDRKGIAAWLELASRGDDETCPEISVVWPCGAAAAGLAKRAPLVRPASGLLLQETETGELR